MDITDRRVVQFRQWAERRFGIGSGPWGDEDLLSVVMLKVDELIDRRLRPTGAARHADRPVIDAVVADEVPIDDPRVLDWMKREVERSYE